ncbi:MAG: SusC/RagA family TonB-linked outer membrane protein, partial [Tannerellaceae bacterium]|nr:SusC/RagA family TonB-linked outer membrane protein [Tannerellaceae bacterium]
MLKGIVKDERGEAVIGANVIQKGTTQGTITDIDGQFEMQVSEGTVLQVSYIGYNTREVRITNQTAIHIDLQEDNQALEEVVVVGYGTQKKVNLAGAVESISSKTLENRSTSNVGIALQGLVPNLNITLSGGQATDTPSFNVRGTTSVNSADPLILVDGIPTSAGDFGRMNGMDIENISVLKDASSAAIYGARAAFGVILVTTKKGQGEKLTVHFNNNFNVRTLTRMPKPVLDPYIQASYKKEMGKPWYDLYTDEEVEYALRRRNDPSLPGTIISTVDPSKYTYLDNTNWFDEVFDKIGTARTHNLSISGASNKVSYYLGAEVYQERGMLKINKDIYDRFNVRTKVEYRPTEWLTVGNNTALTYYEYDKPMNYYSWLFSTVNSTNPLVPVYNPDGSYTSEGSEIVGTLKEGGKSKEKKATINSQFTADVEVIKNLWNVKADFTAKFINSKLNEWDSDKTIPYRDGPDGPDKYHGWTNFARGKHSNTYYTMFNLYTDVRKDFGIHSFSFVGGYSQEYENYEYFMGERRDMISESYPTPQLAVGEMFIDESITEWSIRSAFYRLNYILDGKYILETNGRYDGTSRFPSSDRFGFFPSVSAAWIVSNEKFFEKAHSIVSHLKIRTSYGSLGNQTVKNGSSENYYPYIPSMSADKVNYLLNGEKPMGIGVPGLVSAALTWEKVYTVNGGIDINFLKNRLTMSGDVYRRDTKDMLTKGRMLPNVLGTSEPQINAADLKTLGWELTVAWRDQFKL